MKWKDIETAPKTDEPIIIGGGSYCGGSIFEGMGSSKRPAIAFLINDGTHEVDPEYADCSDRRRTYYPTHWMPLPTPPTAKDE